MTKGSTDCGIVVQVSLAGQTGKAPGGQEVKMLPTAEAGRADALDTTGADAPGPASQASPAKPPTAAKPSGTAAGSLCDASFCIELRWDTLSRVEQSMTCAGTDDTPPLETKSRRLVLLSLLDPYRLHTCPWLGLCLVQQPGATGLKQSKAPRLSSS